MSSDFVISMVVRAINDVTPVLARVNTELDGLKANLATLNRTAGAVDTAGIEAMAPAMASASREAKNLERETTKAVSAQKGFTALAHAGAGLTVAGGVLGYGVVKGLEMAGELQSTLVTIQDTTGATTKQMQALSDSIMNVSANVSRFSDLEVAGFAQQLSSGGLGSMKNVQSLLMPMTQFADAQMYENKVGSGADAVNMAINMAHLLGHYDPQSLLKSLDTFNKYSVMEPGSSDDLYQTLKYLAPSARMLHMDETSVMQMAALANRVGLTGTHGGTNAADMILRLIPGYVRGMSGKPSPSVMSAMQQLGMVNGKGQSQFFNNKGQIIDFPKMVETLVNDSKKFNPEQLTNLYAHIFGIQGGRAATLFANPKILEQLQGMVNQLHQTKSIGQIQRDQQNTPQGQLNQLRSNSMTAMIRIAVQLGQAFNPFLHALNGVLGALLKFEAQHPRIMKFIAVFTSLAAGVLLTVGPMLMLVGGVGKLVLFLKGKEFLRGLEIIKQITGATKIWAGVQWVLDAAMAGNPVGILIIAVAALIPLVILLITHWKAVVKWVQGVVNWFSHLSTAAKIVIVVLAPFIGIPLLILSNWRPIEGFFVRLWKTIIGWVQSAWHWYQNLGDRVKWLIAVFAPFIGIPLLVISKWKPLETYFTNLWKNVLKPIIDGIGKLTGGAIKGFEQFFHIGNWQQSQPPTLAGSGTGKSNVQVTNNFTISSTDPKNTAREVSKTQDKYYQSRYPKPAVGH